jgi:OmpA-OmpF porin, OOP family
MKKLTLVVSICALIISTNLIAQRTSDIEGVKDYPLVSRFKGSIIEYYKDTKWDSYPLPVSLTDNKFHWTDPLRLEGHVIRTQYYTSLENNPAFILKNFEAAFNKAGFKIIMVKNGDTELGNGRDFFSNYFLEGRKLLLNKFGYVSTFRPPEGAHSYIAAKTNDGKNDVFIAIYIAAFTKVTIITQDIIEVESAATGMVTATSLKDGITSNGHIALEGIFFDPGSSTIKTESAQALKNISEYLKANPDSKFFIVGHTDNTGTYEANTKLSEERAKAVTIELTTKYAVKPDQLKAFGLASLAPVTSNDTEQGKAKNRRVEIVKQ